MAGTRERRSPGAKQVGPRLTARDWEELTRRAGNIARRLMPAVKESPVLAQNRLVGELQEVIVAAEGGLGAEHKALWRRLEVWSGIGLVQRDNTLHEALGNPFKHMVSVDKGGVVRLEWADGLTERQKTEQNEAVARWMSAEAAALAQWALDHVGEMDSRVALAAMHAERLLIGASVSATRDGYARARALEQLSAWRNQHWKDSSELRANLDKLLLSKHAAGKSYGQLALDPDVLRLHEQAGLKKPTRDAIAKRLQRAERHRDTK